MLLQDFAKRDGSINYVAACQQMALTIMVYAHATANVRALIAPEGNILDERDQGGTWLPSVLLLNSGDVHRVFVVISGTVDAMQFIMQGGPANTAFRQNTGPGDVSAVGLYWSRAYAALRDRLVRFIDFSDPLLRLFVTGHSLGGCMAQLAAFEFARRIDPSRVQCMTFGQPRTMTSGYNQPQPSTYFRLVSIQDTIPQFPSAGLGAIIPVLSDANTWNLGLPTWQHYGTEVLLAADGSNASQPVSVAPLPPYVSVGRFAEHNRDNYIGRLGAAAEKYLTDPDRTVALAAVKAGTDTLQGVPSVTVTNAITPQDWGLTNEQTNAIISVVGPIGGFAYLSLGGPMAGPFKFTWTIIGPANTQWTETYLTSSGSNAYSISSVVTAAADARVKFLANVYSIVTLKVSDVTQPRAGYDQNFVVAGQAPIAGAGVLPAGIAPAEVALLYRFNFNDGSYTLHYLRGWPANQVQNTTGAARFSPPAMDSLVQDFVNQLRQAGCGRRTLAPINPLPGFPGSYNPIQSIDGVTVPGQATFTCSFPIQPQVGGLISISKADKKTCNGLDGIWQMYNVSGNTFTIPYRTINQASIPGNGGRIRNHWYTGFSIFDLPQGGTKRAYFQNQVKRGTKNLFGRGRRARSAPGIRTSA